MEGESRRPAVAKPPASVMSPNILIFVPNAPEDALGDVVRRVGPMGLRKQHYDGEAEGSVGHEVEHVDLLSKQPF